MPTTYAEFMTPERVYNIIHASETLEGLHYILETLAQTAYIPDKPPQFYDSDLYMMIGFAFGRCDDVLKRLRSALLEIND